MANFDLTKKEFNRDEYQKIYDQGWSDAENKRYLSQSEMNQMGKDHPYKKGFFKYCERHCM